MVERNLAKVEVEFELFSAPRISCAAEAQYLNSKNAGIAQLVERNLAKVEVEKFETLFPPKNSCAAEVQYANSEKCGNSSVGRAQPCQVEVEVRTLFRSRMQRSH